MPAKIGFDVEGAIRTLHTEAVLAGALPKDDPRALSPEQTAEAHLHGFGNIKCEQSPCRTAGLCHALYELLLYRSEASDVDGVVAAADETERVRKEFVKHGVEYLKALEKLVEKSEERHQLLRAFGRKEPKAQHRVLCRFPARIMDEMIQLRVSLVRFEKELRGSVWSFQLQQSGDSRSADLLLTAVYQHLRWGGLKYKEIADLVPDGGGSRGRGERVRSRVKSDNACCLLPRERYGESAKRDAEKRAKVYSSS